MKANTKIAIGYNTSRYVWMMRSNLIRSLKDRGFSVVVLAPSDDYSARVKGLGVEFFDVPMKMNKNPFTDLIIFLRFLICFLRARPSIYLGFTAKPNIYGSLAANLTGVAVVNNIAGLGSAFIRGGISAKILKFLYQISLARSNTVFFQNPDDAKLFTSERIVGSRRIKLLPGSGVDLQKFEFEEPLQRADQKFRFLLIARLLRDKGIAEYVFAANKIRLERSDVEFLLLGEAESDNPAAISHKKLSDWQEQGIVRYLGFAEDARPHIYAADCVVLPSYREGTPRSLLEAAACGRPVIAADSVGCREAVIDARTGLLCAARDSHDLEKKMRMILDMPFELRAQMGREGRLYVESRFDERIVIDSYISVIDRALGKGEK